MANDVDVTRYSAKFVDVSKRHASTFAVNITQFSDQAGYTAARDALETALGNISQGELVERNASLPQVLADGQGGDGLISSKILVRYQSVNSPFSIYSVTVPCALEGLALLPNTDLIDISVGAAAAFVTAFQNFVITPDGNGCEVRSMEYVGRNIGRSLSS